MKNIKIVSLIIVITIIVITIIVVFLNFDGFQIHSKIAKVQLSI